jgi:hypothetical protein
LNDDRDLDPTLAAALAEALGEVDDLKAQLSKPKRRGALVLEHLSSLTDILTPVAAVSTAVADVISRLSQVIHSVSW